MTVLNLLAKESDLLHIFFENVRKLLAGGASATLKHKSDEIFSRRFLVLFYACTLVCGSLFS